MGDEVCAAVVLAAGASTRLGQPKQLVVLDGEVLLVRTVRIALEAGCSPAIVVTGFEAEKMQAALTGFAVKFAHNAEWQDGMGSSLRCGVETLDSSAQRAMLLVCDQLALSSDVLRGLLLTHSSCGNPIVASRYDGRLGVPAIFSSRFFPELCAVAGDRGARGVLESHANEVTTFDFPAGNIDLDTAEQLESLDLPTEPLRIARSGFSSKIRT